jgi:hypothetical protein
LNARIGNVKAEPLESKEAWSVRVAVGKKPRKEGPGYFIGPPSQEGIMCRPHHIGADVGPTKAIRSKAAPIQKHLV